MLEDDRMGTFDQLLQTQEEVAKLQSQLEAANRRVEIVGTQLQTEHIKGTVRFLFHHFHILFHRGPKAIIGGSWIPQ